MPTALQNVTLHVRRAHYSANSAFLQIFYFSYQMFHKEGKSQNRLNLREL